MKTILALDQGTTSSRAIMFDATGSILGLAQQEFKQLFPQPGWVEHDANEIWSSQHQVATQAIEATGSQLHDIAAIGITNQRETTVVWDRQSGQPIYNAIVWQDRRTNEYCEQLKAEGHEASIRAKTGLLVDAYFSATKIRWILENVSGARAKAETGRLAFGTIDSWLVYKLTQGRLHITDASNASRTLLYNIHDGCWDDALLDLFDIPHSLLPEVRASSELYGESTANILGKSLPIAGIAGDQQAALFGQQCTQSGSIKTTYGTGCFMLLNTGNKPAESANKLLTTVAWQIDKRLTYALEGSVYTGGAVIQWLRDGLGIIQTAQESESLAASVNNSDGVYFVPAFTGLGAPHWDSYARGTLLGLSRGSNRAHIARAALESIAYQVADLLDTMQQESGITINEMRVDGGACTNNLLMQIQADVIGMAVLRPRITETTALGAAYLAGLATGVWPDLDTLANYQTTEQRFEPAGNADQIRSGRAYWNKAVQRASRWIE